MGAAAGAGMLGREKRGGQNPKQKQSSSCAMRMHKVNINRGVWDRGNGTGLEPLGSSSVGSSHSGLAPKAGETPGRSEAERGFAECH